MRFVLENKESCLGCTACYNICPKACIEIKEDEEGFYYPYIDEDQCINCKQCLRVCPSFKKESLIKPLLAYAAQNEDDFCRLNSSSGGVFYLIASSVINEGGCVFGVVVDELGVVKHSFADKIEELKPFRGSKYVQSDLKDTYSSVRKFLKAGKIVLFSGTPCQIAGLKLFLNSDYSNLLTVDFICHGVSSPGVFRRYLNEQVKNLNISKDIIFSNFSFRNKKKGWKNFGMYYRMSQDFDNENSVLYYKTKRKDPFLRGFLSNLYLRPSCYKCQYRTHSSGSDITLADFWGIGVIKPNFDDDKGTSLLLINTCRGKDIIKKIKMRKISMPLHIIHSLFDKTVQPHNKNRKAFFLSFIAQDDTFLTCIDRYCKEKMYKKIKYALYDILGAGLYLHKLKYYYNKLFR